MATLTATTDPGTGTIRVDVEQTLARDLFSRVVAAGWGNSTTGQAWTTSGGAAGDYNVNGTTGMHVVNTVNVSRRATMDIGTPDMGAQIQISIPVSALTAPIMPSLMIRNSNATNYYFAELSIAPSGEVTLLLRKAVLGVFTTLSSVVLDQVHVPGAIWFIKGEACGPSLKVKAWRSTVTEPGWILTGMDFDLTTGNLVGPRSVLNSANTNGSVNFNYDNFFAYVSQPIRLYRVTPDGVRTEVRGSPGSTENATAAANTAVATFWDGEAPFDVLMTYQLTSACSSTVLLTSNGVNLFSDGFGWLRDPVDPSRNFPIVMEGFFDECVDQDVIVFSGLGGREYENASGVFDHVDASRPVTVSMTRKNLATTLFLTSFSLDDIDSVENIFADGRILSLSLPMIYGWAHRTYGTDYATFFDISQDLIGVDQQVTTRLWTLPLRSSLEPEDTNEGGTGGNGIGGGGATFDDLAASALGTTFNTLTASGETFLQVAQGVGY